MDDIETGLMKKSLFKSMVKRNVRTATFNALQKMQSSHTKINTIQYKGFGLQEYLASDKFKKNPLCLILEQFSKWI